MRATALALALLALPAAAETPGTARCALIGPLTISGYVAFLGDVAAGRREAAGAAAGRLADLVALHERLGCDGAALIGAVECLSARLLAGATAPPEELAEICMTEAGMPTR